MKQYQCVNWSDALILELCIQSRCGFRDIEVSCIAQDSLAPRLQNLVGSFNYSAANPFFHPVNPVSLLALVPIAGFATPLYSITETADNVFQLSPDLLAIVDNDHELANLASGADAHDLQVDLLAAYNFSAAVKLQSPVPAGDTGVNFLQTSQYSVGGSPPVITLAGITIVSDVTGGADYASFIASADLPSSDVVADITGPEGLSAPLYFFEESSSVPDNGVSSVWLLGMALIAIYGAKRCKLMRAL